MDYYGDDALSIRKALHKLRAMAGRVGPSELMASRRAHSPHVEDSEETLVREAPFGDGRLDVRAVQADLDRIRDVADRVHAVATNTVAHRLDAKAEPVSGAEVVRLVKDLAEIYRDWSVVLRATDVFTNQEDQNLLRPVVRALTLFDWEEYVEASGDAMRRLGPASAVGFDDLDGRARIEYRFD